MVLQATGCLSRDLYVDFSLVDMIGAAYDVLSSSSCMAAPCDSGTSLVLISVFSLKVQAPDFLDHTGLLLQPICR